MIGDFDESSKENSAGDDDEGEGGPFENCDHYDQDVVGDNDFDCGDQPYLFIGIGCITILKHPMVQINFLYMYAFASTSKGFKIKLFTFVLNAFSNVSSNGLLARLHNYTDCIFAFVCFSPLCVFKCFLKLPA